jgi:hypothetical protein
MTLILDQRFLAICNAGFQPARRCSMMRMAGWNRPLQIARILFIVIVLYLSYYTNVYAQDYYFSVPKVVMEATVQPEGGALLYYRIDFQNSVTGHAIDIIDIGLPQDAYNSNLMKAWMNGQPASGPIQNSQYVKPGVEVHVGNLAIPAGGSGTFEFEAPIPDLVYQDTTRTDYASFQISPTFFGEQYVEGSTDLTIRVVLPPGLNPDEVLYQDMPFTGKEVDENGNVVVSWNVNRPFTSSYRVGVSFPKRGMQKVVSLSISDLLLRWWRGTLSTEVRGGLSIAAAISLLVIYMRFTGGTGCIFFLPVLIGAAIFFLKVDAAEVLIWPALLILAVIVETARKRRRSKYLPAIASVEGGGIKRGLTAPEAAVLLEFPLNKLITLVLFGMLKKGVIRQTLKDPVIFEVVDPKPVDAVLHDYEKEFLTQLRKSEVQTINNIDFTKPLQSLIDSVAKRMVGYDLDETQSYYKHIISRAWKEAQEVGEIEAWQKKMDEKVDWMMLDPDFTGRFQPYQDRYIPRSYRPISIGTGSVASEGRISSSQGTTRFSDVASSVSGWFQNTAAGAVGMLEGQKGGILNFGSIDKAIGKAMASSGGGSGRSGGGGGCACACAGCACACACAGGGR